MSKEQFMTVRVRFAPSPTGFMHLGNVRAALLNYIFARQHKGTFILRIEDTDASRNLDEAKLRIIQDLAWLNLTYDEGPIVGGNYGPYEQSERSSLYQEQLDVLIESCKVYRCFCTTEELEARRQKQIAMGKPPRYDRTCLKFSEDKIKLKLATGTPFIWRFKINELQVFEIKDLAHGTVTFDMKNFGDFALTRHDGSFPFIFANFVDDYLMKITHVIRGEDHLTNTAQQAALYDAFALQLPTFWHLPIICNKDGEKLSKRDFGFSLEDLKAAGYIPEALSNYMATVGASFKEEVQSLEELVKNFNFNHISSTGQIKYDLDKLTWFNHKWVTRINLETLVEYCRPILNQDLPESKSLSTEKLMFLLNKIRAELKTLKDVAPTLEFYFKAPKTDSTALEQTLGKEKARKIIVIIQENKSMIAQPDSFLQLIKNQAQTHEIKTKEIFGSLRYVLTGKFEGIGMHDLLEILGSEEVARRISLII